MQYFEVAPNQIIRAGADTFTYASTEAIKIGHIVEISVGKKLIVGVVIRTVVKPSYETKTIERIIETTPLPRQLVSLALWMSQYYATPLSLVLQTILPRGMTTKRRLKSESLSVDSRKRTTIVLNESQQRAAKILAKATGTVLLHGVTGSGKTAVYIERARQALAAKQSVIILVPEIALTSQLVTEFSYEFKNVLLTHSKQTEAQRHHVWKTILDDPAPRVIIGPRSALFMPVRDIGLIVIDECHEPSFQQEQSPRYSALRVASKYAEFTKSLVVFGSATPLIHDYYLAKKYDRVITMPGLARANAIEPRVTIIDMTKRAHFSKHRFLSNTLIETLETTFLAGKQALIFHNRRGSSSSTLCENCGWQAGCPRCYIPLNLHADSHTLRCHVCDTRMKVPTSCPQCHHVDIIHKGIGTKLIESELRKLFPKQTIARFDADTATTDTVEQQFEQLKSGQIDMIIGTQVVAKGLDLPELRTVGVIQADAGLSLPDYSSPERTFQLLSQVIGRVGRAEHETSVIVQSYQPHHPVIKDGVSKNFTDFYERTIHLRQHTDFPPFTYLLQLACSYKTEATAIKNAKLFAELIRQNIESVEVLGPTPAFYERTRDTYRWQLVIKSTTRHQLLEVIRLLPPKNWQFELDPISLL